MGLRVMIEHTNYFTDVKEILLTCKMTEPLPSFQAMHASCDNDVNALAS